jgi:predicted N-acyltransferase
VTTHSSISEIAQDEWDELVSLSHTMLRYRWLSHLEDGSLNQFAPRYIIVRDAAGQVVAHAAAYVNSTSLLIFSSGLLRTALDWVRRFFPHFLIARILECGMPVGLGNPISVRRGANAGRAADAILLGLENISSLEAIRVIVVRDLGDESHIFQQLVQRQGYSIVPNLPNTALAIRWESFGEYESAMRSSYRFRLRRRAREARCAGLLCEISPVKEADAATIYRQIRNVDAVASEYRRNVVRRRFFERLPLTSTEWVCFKVLKEKALVAIALVLIDGKAARWSFFGRDNPGARDGAYFLLLAEIVRFAIQRQMHVLEMGLTTYRPKLELGARPEQLRMAVLIRFPGGRFIVHLLRRLNKVAAVTEKDVFKASAPLVD